MTNGQVSGLIGFACLLATGQALFKMSALAADTRAGLGFALVSLFQLPVFWLALLLYGASTLLWIYLLQIIPLNKAYPFAALGFVIVPAISVFLFNEKINLTYMGGAALIVVGILVTTRA